MTSEVVHDDNVARREDREENLPDISAEACAIDWSVDDARRGEPVETQRSQERQGPQSASGVFQSRTGSIASSPRQSSLVKPTTPGQDSGFLRAAFIRSRTPSN